MNRIVFRDPSGPDCRVGIACDPAADVLRVFTEQARVRGAKLPAMRRSSLARKRPARRAGGSWCRADRARPNIAHPYRGGEGRSGAAVAETARRRSAQPIGPRAARAFDDLVCDLILRTDVCRTGRNDCPPTAVGAGSRLRRASRARRARRRRAGSHLPCCRDNCRSRPVT